MLIIWIIFTRDWTAVIIIICIRTRNAMTTIKYFFITAVKPSRYVNRLKTIFCVSLCCSWLIIILLAFRSCSTSTYNTKLFSPATLYNRFSPIMRYYTVVRESSLAGVFSIIIKCVDTVYSSLTHRLHSCTIWTQIEVRSVIILCT